MVKFDYSGNYLAVVCWQKESKHKRYQYRRRALTPTYTQLFMLIDVRTSNLKNFVESSIIAETALFKRYHSERMVRWIEFLNRGHQDVCLVFDNEILYLKIRGKKLESFTRIRLCSSFGSFSSVYCGYYRSTFVFRKSWDKENSCAFGAGDYFEYVRKKDIKELIKMEEDFKSVGRKKEGVVDRDCDSEENKPLMRRD